MGSEFKFTKYFIGDTDHQAAVSDLLSFINKRCRQNGLVPVDSARDAHFVLLVAEGASRWLHFDSKGHYSPLNSLEFTPVITELSSWKPSISCQITPPDGFVLRQYENGELKARYANLNEGNRFENFQSAEDWVPVHEKWEHLLRTGVTSQDFYAALPAPVFATAPTPTYYTPNAELPGRLCDLFGWEPLLNTVAVNHPVKEGAGYRSQAGEYLDAASGIRTTIRCWAHPDPKGQYARHWKN